MRDRLRPSPLTCFVQGSDFTSTAGFDTLVKRLKEGKQMCVDFEECLEKR